MSNKLQVALELGPKGKRVVAVAADWPGLQRAAKTEAAAIERLQAYLPRYQPVAELAGLGQAFADSSEIAVVEQYPGVPSTDFWGISFAFSQFDRQPMTAAELERELALLQASWGFFDRVRAAVSAELQRGPRGGGRDRDQIVRHTQATEQDWRKKLKLPVPVDLSTPAAVRTHREEYCATIRAYHTAGKQARTWPLRYLIRHSAFHTLDHAWEMQDKDLTPHNH